VGILVDSADIAAIRGQATSLLMALDEMELCHAAALLSMAVDALDRVANDLGDDIFSQSNSEDTPAASR
jgi:hypothetical protein